MNRLLEICIVAHDESVLTAELHDHRDDPLCAGLDDAPPVAYRAYEKNRVDSGACKRGAGGTISLHRLDEVGVVSGLSNDFTERVDEFRARPCDPFGRLEHDRVA